MTKALKRSRTKRFARGAGGGGAPVNMQLQVSPAGLLRGAC